MELIVFFFHHEKTSLNLRPGGVPNFQSCCNFLNDFFVGCLRVFAFCWRNQHRSSHHPPQMSGMVELLAFAVGLRSVPEISEKFLLVVLGGSSHLYSKWLITMVIVSPPKDRVGLVEPRKKPSYFPLYWLVKRDPYNGSLKSLYNWVV